MEDTPFVTINSVNTPITGTTFIPGGTWPVTFSFHDGDGHTGTATSQITVQTWGDLNSDGVVDTLDLTIMANYLVHNINQGSGSFSAPLWAADLNEDSVVRFAGPGDPRQPARSEYRLSAVPGSTVTHEAQRGGPHRPPLLNIAPVWRKRMTGGPIRKYLALIIMLTGGVMFGQGLPFNQSGSVTLVPEGGSAGSATVTIDVMANLAGVTGTCVTPVPVVLAGFNVPVHFDPGKAQLASAASCDPAFNSSFTSTTPALANGSGVVTVNAAQANPAAPTGNICLARLTFNMTSAQSQTTFSLDPALSLASALQNCGQGTAGPAAIPVTLGANLVLPTGFSVPAAGTAALAALLILLAAMAIRRLP